MSGNTQMSENTRRAVLRVLARDDLLTLAAAADEAVDIVRSRQTVSRVGIDGKTLFDIALERLLVQAESHKSKSIRAQACDYAAVLLRFCEMVDARPDVAWTPEELHKKALILLKDGETGLALDRDMMTGAFNRYHAARNFRLIGEFDAALKLVKRPVTDLYGTGAEPRTAHYLYELGAVYIQRGRSAQIRPQLMEMESYFENNARASGHSTRYRLDFIRALAQWDDKPDDKDVYRQLSIAVERLRAAEGRTDDTRHGSVRELSVLLATAEYLAATQSSDEAVAEAVRLGAQALEIADQVRARWRVLARSRAPLARVFERVYGDLALLAHSLPGPDAAALGFRVAVAAKQTGFAARIRDGKTFDGNPTINNILAQIVDVEGSSTGAQPLDPIAREKELKELRRRLADAVSPMLEDTVFPSPVDLTSLVQMLGPRYALDFVELHDTLDDMPHLFRTLIEPGGRMWFDLCVPDAGGDDFLGGGRLDGDRSRGGTHDTRDDTREVTPEEEAARPQIDWRKLARAVLPRRLTEEVLADRDTPVRVLISAHSWLSLVPWAALKIDDDGVRLVERAIISQTPILTCLSGDLPPRVAGRALIRLVGRNEHGVNVDLERQAWDFPPGTDGIAPHQCDLLPGKRPSPYPGRLDAALAEPGGWQFVHVASHGGGKGFDQYLDLAGEAGEGPAEQRHSHQLSAARALGLKWPTSVLMASCHVGQVVNDNGAEPLSFVLALLTGGAQCVVAGIAQIDDDGTGQVASHIVRAIRGGHDSLEVALRNAQLAAIKDGITQNGWALLSAYVR
jgi:hypothetical protein